MAASLFKKWFKLGDPVLQDPPPMPASGPAEPKWFCDECGVHTIKPVHVQVVDLDFLTYPQRQWSRYKPIAKRTLCLNHAPAYNREVTWMTGSEGSTVQYRQRIRIKQDGSLVE